MGRRKSEHGWRRQKSSCIPREPRDRVINLPLSFSAHSNDALNLSISPREAKMEFPISASGGKNEINSGERAIERGPADRMQSGSIDEFRRFLHSAGNRFSAQVILRTMTAKGLFLLVLSLLQRQRRRPMIFYRGFPSFSLPADRRFSVECGGGGGGRSRPLGKDVLAKKVARSNLDI